MAYFCLFGKKHYHAWTLTLSTTICSSSFTSPFFIYLCRWFFQASGRGICPLCYLSQWDERLKAWLLSHKLFLSSRLLATFWQFNIKRDHGVSVRGVWGLGRYFGFLMVLSIRLSWTTWSLYCRRDSRTNPGTKVYWSSF